MTWPEVLPTFVAALPSIAVAIANLFLLKRSNQKQLKHNENRQEIDRITQQLTDFYYPYIILAQENTALYKLFSQDHIRKDSNFRTLIALLDKKQFTNNDTAFIKKIVENDKKLNELISLKGNLVDDVNLRDLLIRSSTHYSIIAMAFDGQINGEPARFKSYVYPNEVFTIVQQKRISLEKKVGELRNDL